MEDSGGGLGGGLVNCPNSTVLMVATFFGGNGGGIAGGLLTDAEATVPIAVIGCDIFLNDAANDADDDDDDDGGVDDEDEADFGPGTDAAAAGEGGARI